MTHQTPRTLIAVAPTFIRRHYAILLMDTYSLNACTTIRACRASGKEVDRVEIQTDYSCTAPRRTAALGRAAHTFIVKRSRSQVFLPIRFGSNGEESS